MKTSIDCIPCLVRQMIEATRYVSDDTSVHERVLREILHSLSEINLYQSPPVVGQWMHRRLREVTGNSDPYRQVKDRFNHLALDLLPDLKAKVLSSSDPLKTAALLAITGNVIDMGPKSTLTEDEVRLIIARTLSETFHVDIENLRSEIDKASSILYLADNAGEIVFDRLLIEELPVERVTLAVRGGPIINDATMDDANTAGLHEIISVIDNGSDAPGTILNDCSQEFRRRFEDADLIIAKGHGNYETLSDEKANIFFLFRVKCAVAVAETGFELGTNMLTRALRRIDP